MGMLTEFMNCWKRNYLGGMFTEFINCWNSNSIKGMLVRVYEILEEAVYTTYASMGVRRAYLWQGREGGGWGWGRKESVWVREGHGNGKMCELVGREMADHNNGSR